MVSPSKSTGLIAAAVSFISFGTSGAFVKPLLEAGWSPPPPSRPARSPPDWCCCRS